MHHGAPACLPNQDAPSMRFPLDVIKTRTKVTCLIRVACSSHTSSSPPERSSSVLHLYLCEQHVEKTHPYLCEIVAIHYKGTSGRHRLATHVCSCDMSFRLGTAQKRNKIRQNKLGANTRLLTLWSLQPKPLFDDTNNFYLTNCRIKAIFIQNLPLSLNSISTVKQTWSCIQCRYKLKFTFFASFVGLFLPFYL